MRKIQSRDLEAATNVRKVRHEVDSDVPRGCDWLILFIIHCCAYIITKLLSTT